MRIAIAGASGRMGRMLIETLGNHPNLMLTVALTRPGNPSVGQDATAFLGRSSGVLITDELDALASADCLIDFTRPEATLAYLEACVKHGIPIVIGTTGFDDAGRAAIAAAACRIGVVFAPNMSVGVNATLKVVALAARLLNSGFDVEVFEAHHNKKVDAPSGTAWALGEAVAQAWERDLPLIATCTRHDDPEPRQTGTIGFSVVRGGDIVGDHTVYFCGAGERIEITHRSSSRQTYAEGSLRAAKFLQTHKVGQFDMQAVLGL
jgi:4-hydroxy-tetrahydrodipicolinate reductase